MEIPVETVATRTAMIAMVASVVTGIVCRYIEKGRKVADYGAKRLGRYIHEIKSGIAS
jgi:hypothetical protein